jgi:hypothetical protein
VIAHELLPMARSMNPYLTTSDQHAQRGKLFCGLATLGALLFVICNVRTWATPPLLNASGALPLSRVLPAPAADQKPLNACVALRSGGHTYVLEADISSPGTCLSIQGDNITLDLNGHTITYGSDHQKAAAYGVLGIACWDTSLKNGVADGNPCGGAFDGLTVMNGKIVQAAGSSSYSDAIHLGQGGGNRLQVHDVELSVSGDSAIPIFTTYSGAGSLIYANTIHNDVRTVRNRHQLQGMSVKFDNSQKLSPGQSVHDNQILGGAQGGIFLVTPGATAYANKIGQNGRYSNDFSIYLWGNHEEVYKNDINVTSGRGIQIAGGAVSIGGSGKGGSHSTAHDNKIEVIELKQNCDYSEKEACNVCQLGGAYGIQFDDNPQGDAAFNNVVLARAAECDASALRITDSEVPTNESHDDSFTAVRSSATSANAYGWDNAGPTAFTARNDTFIGDTASYHANWDGAENESCVDCTFGKGAAHPSPNYVTFSFENGGKIPVQNIHFQDSKFVGGAKKDSTDMKPILANQDWPGPAEYFIDWTFTLLVQDPNEKPMPGAAVSIMDSAGHTAFQGVTSQEGKIAVPLTEFRMYNTSSRVVKEQHTPYRVTIKQQGCGDSPSFFIDLKEPTSHTAKLACPPR